MNVQDRPLRDPVAVQAVIDRLRPGFGDRLSSSHDLCVQHANTTTWIANQPPDAVVFPETTEEVQAIVRACAAHCVPVIGFGAGSSLEGQVNAPRGGISVDFARMNRVIAVNQADMDCMVQPGITHRQLNTELRATGLFFPVDPGADASLGGMASTRASGTNAVRYGTMKERVLSLTAVLPSGECVTTGARARKSAAGYDLTSLIVGSEGTLGLITELALHLAPIPEAVSAASCTFSSVHAACDAVIETIQYGVPVARIELLDALCVKAVNAYSKLSLPEQPLLLLEFHGSEAGVAEQAETFGAIAEEHGSQAFEWTANADERNRLWRARHDAFWAIKALQPGAEAVATDICVPVSNLAACVEEATSRAAADGLIAPLVGHVGDGNFHFGLLLDAGDPAQKRKMKDFVGWLAELAISMDGTCTGEHGIGQGKTGYLERELGSGALGVMAAIKAAIDPQDIFNPGKILPGETNLGEAPGALRG